MEQVEIHKSNPKQLGLSMRKSIYLRAMTIAESQKISLWSFFFFLTRKMIEFFPQTRLEQRENQLQLATSFKINLWKSLIKRCFYWKHNIILIF